jgi:hypothetical protein
MITTPRLWLIAACVGCLSVAAAAQTPLSDDSNISFQSGLLIKKPKPGLPEVKTPPQAWPRLDPGARLCRTEPDLDRLAARRNGEDDGGPINCQMVRDPTAITIIQRRGPGKTEVTYTSGQVGTTGWTDAWLPDKAPASARSAAK